MACVKCEVNQQDVKGTNEVYYEWQTCGHSTHQATQQNTKEGKMNPQVFYMKFVISCCKLEDGM